MMLPFVAAIFVSATLLFTVQPFTGKLLLPLAGGSPQVWNTCMVFFQGVLLAGYLYAHGLSKLSVKVQVGVHLLVLAIAAIVLPVDVAGLSKMQSPLGETPTAWLLMVLTMSVGLPFFAVSTTAPLLQSWFARSGHVRAKDPYFLYVASNAGSVVGLLSYPLLIEPLFTRQQQAMAWMGGYGLFFVLIVGCTVLVVKSGAIKREILNGGAIMSSLRGGSSDKAIIESKGDAGDDASLVKGEVRGVTLKRRLLWIAFAFVPSSLMLGVTQYISTDLAAVPLLWVVPLLLYLVTFMLAFASSIRVSAELLGRATPIAIMVMAVVMLTQAREPVMVVILVHVVGFFVLAWMCHRRLAEDRPAPKHLTEFYLLMSVGGVLGGIFNAFVATSLFDVVAEYPLAIAAACFLTPQCARDWRASRGGSLVKRLTQPTAMVAGLVLVLAVIVVAEGLIQNGSIKEASMQSLLRGGVPIGLCALLLLWRGTPRFAVAIAGAMFVAPYLGTVSNAYVTRTFFGVHRVSERVGAGWQVNELYHGTTLHGVQFRMDEVTQTQTPLLTAAERYELFFGPKTAVEPGSPEALARRATYQLVPTTYYHPRGPIGDVMKMLIDTKKLDYVAFIGMGTGTLAAYAQPNSTFVFFEIDAAVDRIAMAPAYFTYVTDALRDNTVRIGTVLGDGRRTIVASKDAEGVKPFRLIVVDAFSSDAIPVHLITKEAVEAYFSRTTEDGLVAFHISNRYFDLSPVLARQAKELGLVAYIRNDPIEDLEMQKRDSLWVVLARKKADLGVLATRNALWTQMDSDAKDPLWTDEYSDVLGVFVPLRELMGRGRNK